MKINDAHLHISETLNSYDLDVEYRNIIYNFIDEYKQKADEFRNERTHQTLIFDFRSDENLAFLYDEINNGRVHGIKIHSRIQQIPRDGYAEVFKKIKDLPTNIPITFDAFYDGPDLPYQPSKDALAKLIEVLPEHKIVIAHSGGYEVLKYFFHFRTVSNIYFDLSLSLHYLGDSSVKTDLIKLLRFVKKERILFGTDFPFAPAGGQKDQLLKFCKEAGLTNDEIHQVFYQNYLNVFGG